MARCFLAAEVPSDVRDAVAAWQRSLKKVLGDSVRWTRPGQWHVTVRFVGEVAEDRIGVVMTEVARAFAGAGTVPLRLGEPGCFPRPERPRVFWVGVEGDGLADWRRRVDAGLSAAGIGLDSGGEEPFVPHLTIGRCRMAGARTWERFRGVVWGGAGLGWTARELVLFGSELGADGARHAVLGRYAAGSGERRS